MFGKKMILSAALCFSAFCISAYAEDEVASCDACEEVVAVQEPVEAAVEVADEVAVEVADEVAVEVADEVTLEREELKAEATEDSTEESAN